MKSVKDVVCKVMKNLPEITVVPKTVCLKYLFKIVAKCTACDDTEMWLSLLSIRGGGTL